MILFSIVVPQRATAQVIWEVTGKLYTGSGVLAVGGNCTTLAFRNCTFQGNAGQHLLIDVSAMITYALTQSSFDGNIKVTVEDCQFYSSNYLVLSGGSSLITTGAVPANLAKSLTVAVSFSRNSFTKSGIVLDTLDFTFPSSMSITFSLKCTGNNITNSVLNSAMGLTGLPRSPGDPSYTIGIGIGALPKTNVQLAVEGNAISLNAPSVRGILFFETRPINAVGPSWNASFAGNRITLGSTFTDAVAIHIASPSMKLDASSTLYFSNQVSLSSTVTTIGTRFEGTFTVTGRSSLYVVGESLKIVGQAKTSGFQFLGNVLIDNASTFAIRDSNMSLQTRVDLRAFDVKGTFVVRNQSTWGFTNSQFRLEATSVNSYQQALVYGLRFEQDLRFNLSSVFQWSNVDFRIVASHNSGASEGSLLLADKATEFLSASSFTIGSSLLNVTGLSLSGVLSFSLVNVLDRSKLTFWDSQMHLVKAGRTTGTFIASKLSLQNSAFRLSNMILRIEAPFDASLLQFDNYLTLSDGSSLQLDSVDAIVNCTSYDSYGQSLGRGIRANAVTLSQGSTFLATNWTLNLRCRSNRCYGFRLANVLSISNRSQLRIADSVHTYRCGDDCIFLYSDAQTLVTSQSDINFNGLDMTLDGQNPTGFVAFDAFLLRNSSTLTVAGNKLRIRSLFSPFGITLKKGGQLWDRSQFFFQNNDMVLTSNSANSWAQSLCDGIRMQNPWSISDLSEVQISGNSINYTASTIRGNENNLIAVEDITMTNGSSIVVRANLATAARIGSSAAGVALHCVSLSQSSVVISDNSVNIEGKNQLSGYDLNQPVTISNSQITLKNNAVELLGTYFLEGVTFPRIDSIGSTFLCDGLTANVTSTTYNSYGQSNAWLIHFTASIVFKSLSRFSVANVKGLVTGVASQVDSIRFDNAVSLLSGSSFGLESISAVVTGSSFVSGIRFQNAVAAQGGSSFQLRSARFGVKGGLAAGWGTGVLLDGTLTISDLSSWILEDMDMQIAIGFGAKGVSWSPVVLSNRSSIHLTRCRIALNTSIWDNYGNSNTMGIFMNALTVSGNSTVLISDDEFSLTGQKPQCFSIYVEGTSLVTDSTFHIQFSSLKVQCAGTLAGINFVGTVSLTNSQLAISGNGFTIVSVNEPSSSRASAIRFGTATMLKTGSLVCLSGNTISTQSTQGMSVALDALGSVLIQGGSRLSFSRNVAQITSRTNNAIGVSLAGTSVSLDSSMIQLSRNNLSLTFVGSQSSMVYMIGTVTVTQSIPSIPSGFLLSRNSFAFNGTASGTIFYSLSFTTLASSPVDPRTQLGFYRNSLRTSAGASGSKWTSIVPNTAAMLSTVSCNLVGSFSTISPLVEVDPQFTNSFQGLTNIAATNCAAVTNTCSVVPDCNVYDATGVFRTPRGCRCTCVDPTHKTAECDECDRPFLNITATPTITPTANGANRRTSRTASQTMTSTRAATVTKVVGQPTTQAPSVLPTTAPATHSTAVQTTAPTFTNSTSIPNVPLPRSAKTVTKSFHRKRIRTATMSLSTFKIVKPELRAPPSSGVQGSIQTVVSPAVASIAVATGGASAAVTSVMAPSAAGQAVRVGLVASIVECDSFDPFNSVPSYLEHPVQMHLFNGPLSLTVGSMLCSTILFLALPLLATGVGFLVGRLRPGNRVAQVVQQHVLGSASVIGLGYFLPNIAQSAIMVIVHGSDTASTIVVCVCLGIGLLWVVLLGVFLLRYFSSVVRVVEREPGKWHYSATGNKEHTMVLETFFPFFDASRQPHRWLCRLYLVEDVSISILLAILSGIRSGSCVAIGSLMLALCLFHLLYLILERPYRSRLELGFCFLNGTVLATLSGIALALTIAPQSNSAPSLTNALGYLALAETALFFLQAIAMGFWAYTVKQRRLVKERAKVKLEEEGHELSNSVDSGTGGDIKNPSVEISLPYSNRTLVVPEEQGLDRNTLSSPLLNPLTSGL